MKTKHVAIIGVTVTAVLAWAPCHAPANAASGFKMHSFHSGKVFRPARHHRNFNKLCRAGTRRLCLTATHCAYLSEEQGDQDRSVGEWRNARDNDHALLTAVPSRHDGDMPIGAGGFAIKQKRWPNNAGPAFAGPFCRTACSLTTRPSPAAPGRHSSIPA